VTQWLRAQRQARPWLRHSSRLFNMNLNLNLNPMNPMTQSQDTTGSANKLRRVPQFPTAQRPPFPPVQDFTDWTDSAFPVIATPWANQIYVYWEYDTGLFWDEHGVSFNLQHISPKSTNCLFGELGVFGQSKAETWRRIMRGGMDITDISFRLLDINRQEDNANTRAFKLVNLPAQDTPVVIPQVMQLGDKEAANTYLQKWQEAGFAGALVKPLENMLYAPQYSLTNPLA
jgi:hypothetical protein